MKKYQYLASWDDQTLTRVGEPVVVLGDSNVSQVEVTLPSNFLLDPTKAECRMYFLLPGEKESAHDVLETAVKDENGDSHVTWTIKHVHSQKGGRLAFSLTIIGDDAQWDSRTAIIPVYESRYQPESEEAEKPYTGRLDALEGSVAAIRGEFAEVQDDFEELKETATLGTPIPESLVANMQEGHVYIYTGTETGYAAGHVYYYVGGALTDGGVYGGTAVDATLTEPGQAADAKKTGDEISAIKEDLSATSETASMLLELNAAELLGPSMMKENYESSYGLHFDYIGGNAYRVYGTTTRTSFYNLYNNKTQLPQGMTAGETYKLMYSGVIVWFYVFVYTSDDPETAIELFRSNNSKEFTIPSNAVGMMLRISVLGEGRVVDETVIPEITNGWYEISQKSKLLYQTNSRALLSPIMSVTDYTAHNVTMTYIGNGQFHVQSAGSERTAFKSLFKQANSMPDGMSAGETYFVSFTGVNVRFYVIYTTDRTNWVTLVSTTESRKFTIPEDAIGLDIRITVLNAGTIVDEVVSPEIYTAYSDQILSRHLLATDDSIEYKQPLLTIIDDDGNLGFYTDLLPLIESKNISISTAVVGYRIAEAEAGTRPTYMTWDKIVDAYNRGAEVLSHSYSHWGEDAVNSRSVGEVANDYTIMRHLLSSHGIDTGDILVYPGASGSSAIARAASERTSICAIRSSGNVTNFYGATARYDIKRYRIENEYSYDLTQVEQLIDELAKTGGWMVWVIHTSQNWNANSLATVTSAIDYALAKNIPIVSAHYGAKKYLGIN